MQEQEQKSKVQTHPNWTLEDRRKSPCNILSTFTRLQKLFVWTLTKAFDLYLWAYVSKWIQFLKKTDNALFPFRKFLCQILCSIYQLFTHHLLFNLIAAMPWWLKHWTTMCPQSNKYFLDWNKWHAFEKSNSLITWCPSKFNLRPPRSSQLASLWV